MGRQRHFSETSTLIRTKKHMCKRIDNTLREVKRVLLGISVAAGFFSFFQFIFVFFFKSFSVCFKLRDKMKILALNSLRGERFLQESCGPDSSQTKKNKNNNDCKCNKYSEKGI